MEICKAPTLRLKVKAPNKCNITHIMYIEMKNVISNLTKKLTHASVDQQGFKHSLEKQWSQIHKLHFYYKINPSYLVA